MRLAGLALFLLLSLFTPALAQDGAPAAPSPAAGVDDLIQLLEDEDARNALIARLRAEAPPTPEQAARAAEGTDDPTVARQIAEYTREIAESASATVTAVIDLAGDIGHAGRDWEQLSVQAANLLILAAALFASYFVLKLAVRRAQKAISDRVAGRRWISRITGMVGAASVDLGAVAAAWAIGYLVALYGLGGATGRMAIDHTLLLNAFLVVETIKVGLRVVFEPHGSALRPLPMSDTNAAYWYFWFARITGLLGYSFLFFAPILADTVSAGAAQALRILAMLTAVIIGILIVLQNRAVVRDAIARRADMGKQDALSKTLAYVGGWWHLIAVAYLIALFVVWLTNPEQALPFMVQATLQSVIAIAVGVAVTAFIARFIHVGVRLPDDVKERLPLLEARLHAFVPRVMQVVRTIVLVGVIIAIAQAWQLIDFLGWAASETGQHVTGSAISALIIVLIGFAAYIAMSSWVEYRLNPNFGTVPTAREKTLLSLFRNAFTIALAIMVLMLALGQIGINIAPLIAGAGVLGLAIGFGAQKFVQDIITGVFIQLENVMNEGDVVEAGGRVGVVERLTIRSVSIRSLDGTLHLIPFSSVDLVSNLMQGFSFHVAEIRVAYREDIAQAKQAMREAFDLLMESEHKASILEPLEMHGVTELTESAVIVRARIKTLPGDQWPVGRAYNELVKMVFDQRGIEIPFPHLKLHMDGKRARQKGETEVQDGGKEANLPQ